MQQIKINHKILVPAIILLYGIIFSRFYFTHEYVPTHDYNVTFPSSHIVMNYFINGHMPLWAPEQNCGSPVWPDTEVFPGYDPVALVVNFIFSLIGSNSVYSHIVTIFIWHVIFAFGALLLFRRLGLSKTASLFGFGILLFSSLTALNFRQGDDYVTIYRYTTLLFYGLVRYFQGPTFKNSIFLGLIAGVAISGYQTMNIIVLCFFIFLAAIPFLIKSNRELYFNLVPAFIVTLLIWLPTIVAGFFWVTNKAVCREFFIYGYRGDLADILGPLSRVYADETTIYIGLIPLVFAFLRIWRLIKNQFTVRTEKYWPSLFVLVSGIFIWIMYIGFPENFTGVDKPFFNIRSFNNMLPYILLIMVYFSSEYINKLEDNFKNTQFNSNNKLTYGNFLILAVLALGAAVTIFTGLSRPSILTRGINRYSLVFGPFDPILFKNFIPHFSLGHFLISIAFFISIVILSIGMLKRHKNVIFASIFIITVIELALVNNMLLLKYYVRENQQDELRPLLKAPMARKPPIERPRLFNYEGIWYKEGNVLYHNFSSYSDIRVTWFQTSMFYDFVRNISTGERFDFLTGVTRPIIYFANEVIPKPKGDIMPALNLLSEEELSSSIVVDNDEFPLSYPLKLGYNNADFEVLDYGPNSIKIKVQTDSPAYLMYLDSYSKDWKAYLDNKSMYIIRANYLFKSVLVPGGGHIVEFKYKPYPYIFSFYARIAGFLGAVILLLFGDFRPVAFKLR